MPFTINEARVIVDRLADPVYEKRAVASPKWLAHNVCAQQPENAHYVYFVDMGNLSAKLHRLSRDEAGNVIKAVRIFLTSSPLMAIDEKLQHCGLAGTEPKHNDYEPTFGDAGIASELATGCTQRN